MNKSTGTLELYKRFINETTRKPVYRRSKSFMEEADTVIRVDNKLLKLIHEFEYDFHVYNSSYPVIVRCAFMKAAEGLRKDPLAWKVLPDSKDNFSSRYKITEEAVSFNKNIRVAWYKNDYELVSSTYKSFFGIKNVSNCKLTFQVLNLCIKMNEPVKDSRWNDMAWAFHTAVKVTTPKE